jgi:hypothetical protein
MGVLPTATEVSAIAVSRNIYRDEAADSAIASVLRSAITISTGVAVAFYGAVLGDVSGETRTAARRALPAP